ncbi:MAG: transposase, partial [Bdellovibrionota bacterium]
QKSTCPNCKKTVTAPHPKDVPANQQIGPKTDALLSYLHLYQHIPLERLAAFLSLFANLNLSEAAILQALERTKKRVASTMDLILEDIKTSSVLGADETSWRVGGVKHWAWVFRTDRSSYIVIAKSRAARVPMLVLGRELNAAEIQAFETDGQSPEGGQVVVINRLNAKKREHYLFEVSGTLVADNWTAYNQVMLKQDCLAHLIRHLTYDAAIEEKQGETTCADLRQVLQDAIHLGKQRHNHASYPEACANIERRFDAHLLRPSTLPSTKTRLKALNERRDFIFPFLYNEIIPPTNNGSENDVRKLVIHRKICGGSRSSPGADRTAAISSFIQTAVKRGVNVLSALLQPQIIFSTS